MPFLDDIGVRDAHRGPIAAAIAALADQVERLVAVNVGWSLGLVPGFLAVAFPTLPGALRVALLAASTAMLGATTGPMFVLARVALEGDPVGLEAAADAVRTHARGSLITLSPLYCWIGILGWALTASGYITVIQVGLGWVLLMSIVCASYWGPTFAAHPRESAWRVLIRSLRTIWARPVTTLSGALIAGAVAALGVVSVAGLFLIAPVTAALIQTSAYVSTHQREAGHAKSRP